MSVIDLTPICERLSGGLAHGPEQSDWDPNTVLWSCSGWAQFGAVDGWLWANDGSTALIEKSVDLADMEHDAERGRAVIRLCHDKCVSPFQKVMLCHLAIAGGKARVPGLGDFDLDRLWQAAQWVYGGPPGDGADASADSVLIHIEHGERDDRPSQLAYVIGHHDPERRAVVMGAQFTGDWFPTIEFPLAPAVFEGTPEQGSART